jgi:citrate synthase
MPGRLKVPPGLDGVTITESRIAKSGPDGSLVYRGYDIAELAKNASFEETAYLIMCGNLPNARELDSFSSRLRTEAFVDKPVFDVMGRVPPEAHPMDVLRTALSVLASLDLHESPADMEISIAAKMPVLAANCLRVPSGLPPVGPREDLSLAANLLSMITGRVPTEEDLWIFERVLILYMEHDLNASSFTVRVVASTGADPYAAVTAGLAALKGPLHGGANEAAMRVLLEVKDPGKAEEYLERAIREKRKVIGFGHRVYKRFDPRARLCEGYLRELARSHDDGADLLRLCNAMETEMWRRKKIPPNLDFYAAPILYLLGIPIPLFTPIFASSRVFGWLAHYNEQLEEKKLIRPDADYVGPTGLRYVPLKRR